MPGLQCQHDCARLDQSIGSLGIGSYVSWYAPDGTRSTSSNPSPISPNPALPTSTPPPRSSLRSRSRSISRQGGGSGTGSGAGETAAVDKYFPLATATLETSVFDVVHIFSERGISAVPIVDADGIVINLYETVDIVVRPSFSASS